MFFSTKYFLILFLIFSIIGCSKKNIEVNINQTEKISPETQYIEAKKFFDSGQYDEALFAFQNIDKRYPLSNWALRSKIMNIFILYIKMDYENASIDIDRFINKYPDYKDIDYVYYLKALIAYEQIKNPSLDISYTTNSLFYFEELIRRFPDSDYAKDAKRKIILLNTILAGKDMHVGMYYLQKNEYIAALNRFKKIITDYEPNRYTPEALHRIVEIYYSLGMIDNATKTAAVLGYNYPDNIWYKRSYKIVGGKNLEVDEDKSWRGKLFKKIF